MSPSLRRRATFVGHPPHLSIDAHHGLVSPFRQSRVIEGCSKRCTGTSGSRFATAARVADPRDARSPRDPHARANPDEPHA